MKWIDAFLCFRQQRVVVNGVKSDWAPVVSGVPQGTVLGPLLFSQHINDIMPDIESEIRLFADDCVCYRESKGMSSGVRISERLNHVPKSEPNFSIRRFDKNIKIVQKCTVSCRKYFRIITQQGNMTSSRTSDFADENTTIGDNCHRCVFV